MRQSRGETSDDGMCLAQTEIGKTPRVFSDAVGSKELSDLSVSLSVLCLWIWHHMTSGEISVIMRKTLMRSARLPETGTLWCCIFCCYFLLTYPPICSSFTWCSDFEFDINFNFPSISYSESRGSVFLRVMLNASAQPSTNSQVYRFSNARSCIQCPPGATWSKCGCGCLQRFKLEFQVGF